MVIKTGRYGKFLACPNFPKCKNTKPLEEIDSGRTDGQAAVSDTISLKSIGDGVNGSDTPETTEICDKCGRPMAVRSGRYGNFLACTGYPECKNIKSLNNAAPASETGDFGSVRNAESL